MTKRISFRSICEDVPSTTYATHGLHPYPAKLIPHIPHFFISRTHFSKNDDIVLDPFCGSGTTLVEARLNGRNSFGVDVNPLARLLTKVKTTTLEVEKLQPLFDKIMKDAIVNEANEKLPTFPDVDYWFSHDAQCRLMAIRESVRSIKETDYRDFFDVCFSAIVRRCSYADPRISPACKSKRMRALIKKGWEPAVYEIFKNVTSTNIRHCQEFVRICPSDGFARLVEKSASQILLEDGIVDLVITSPPYINAQKYVRSTKLEIYWLDLLTKEELSELDTHLIGTERARFEEYRGLNPAEAAGSDRLRRALGHLIKIDRRRAYIAYRYFKEMDAVFEEMHRVLKKGGHLVLVIGDNTFYGSRFPSSEVLKEMAKQHQFRIESVYVDAIKSRGLMTKRNKTADMIDSEWIFVLKK